MLALARSCSLCCFRRSPRARPAPAAARQRHRPRTGRRNPRRPRPARSTSPSSCTPPRLARLLAEPRRRRPADARRMALARGRHRRAAALPGADPPDHRRADELCLRARPCDPRPAQRPGGRERTDRRARQAQLARLHRQGVRPRAGRGFARHPDRRRSATADPRFNEWRRALPRPLASPARFAPTGDRIEVALRASRQRRARRTLFLSRRRRRRRLCRAASLPPRRRHAVASLQAQRRSARPPSPACSRSATAAACRSPPPPARCRRAAASIGDLGANAILLAVLGALLGGLLLNLMPCVFPILALKALHLARSGGDERARAARGARLCGGRDRRHRAARRRLARDPRRRQRGGLGVPAPGPAHDPGPAAARHRHRAQPAARRSSCRSLGGEARPSGSFGTGALAAFVATPCAGPFLGAALGAALLLPAAGSVLVFAALGLGLALPFVLLAFVPALAPPAAQARPVDGPPPALPRHPDGRDRGRPACDAGAAGRGGRRSASGSPPSPRWRCCWCGSDGASGAAGRPGSRRWSRPWPSPSRRRCSSRSVRKPRRACPRAPSRAAKRRWRASLPPGRPVFVYFTADWCLTCKVNEAAAIDRDRGPRRLRARPGSRCWSATGPTATPRSAASSKAAARAGVPLYLWYEPGSGRSPRNCRRS